MSNLEAFLVDIIRNITEPYVAGPLITLGVAVAVLAIYWIAK